MDVMIGSSASQPIGFAGDVLAAPIGAFGSRRPAHQHKVLFIGDVHIKHRAVDDALKLIAAIERIGAQEAAAGSPITRVIIAGDVLDTHERVDTQLLNRAYELVRVARDIAPVAVLVGNHDYINNQQFLTTNHWMNGMKEWRDVTIVDAPIIVDNGAFALTPYVYPGRLVEALDRLRRWGPCGPDRPSGLSGDWRDTLCVFAHQEIRGCRMGHVVSDVGDEWSPSWPPIVSGHIHERQRPAFNVFYPGAALHHAFGSAGSSGVSILTAFVGAIPPQLVKEETAATIDSAPIDRPSGLGGEADRDSAVASGEADRDSMCEQPSSASLPSPPPPPHYFDERRIAIDDVAQKRTVYANLDALPRHWTEEDDGADEDAALASSTRLSLAGSAAEIEAFKLSVAYRRLLARGVKLVYRVIASDADRSSSPPRLGSYDRRRNVTRRRGLFYDVLDGLVRRENDASLENDYKAILCRPT
jgi:UDP-2,3-diacylglucosamine pyrophosphatase LpxH